MSHGREPTREVLLDDLQPGSVVLVRVAGITRWFLLDRITTDPDTWHGRLVRGRPGHDDGVTFSGPADEWRRRCVRRCVRRAGYCVIKSAKDAAQDRVQLDQLREEARLCQGT